MPLFLVPGAWLFGAAGPGGERRARHGAKTLEGRPVAPSQQFCVERVERDGCPRLVLAGDLDLGSALELELTVMRVCLDRPREIEIDLRGLRFIDSSGLRGLLLSRYTCEEHLVDLRFLPPVDRQQRAMFERCGCLSGTGAATAAPFAGPGAG